MKFNQLTVIEEVTQKKRKMWVVRCDCGNSSVKRKDHVRSGRAKSCKSCASKRTALTHPPPVIRKGCEGLSGTHFNAIKHGADRRKIPFKVTPEYLWGLFDAQGGLCALTGLPLVLESAIKGNNPDWSIITASLDRIDSSLGYVVGNLWWTHKEANRLKNHYSMQELLYWVSLIHKAHIE